MTRKEQIAVAFDDYSDALKLSICDDFDYLDIQLAFAEGTEWADKHPKSQWMRVEDDLPCYHPELMRNEVYTKKIIVLLNDGRIRETDMFYDKWTQYRKKITHWQPFIEPTKE